MKTMKPPEDCDLVLLGSGTGAKLLAWIFAERGHRAAVVERKYVGGVCPNIACLPSNIAARLNPVGNVPRRSKSDAPRMLLAFTSSILSFRSTLRIAKASR
jgi:hypothetical protein